MKQSKSVAQGFSLAFKEATINGCPTRNLLIKAKALSYMLLMMCNSALQGCYNKPVEDLRVIKLMSLYMIKKEKNHENKSFLHIYS